MGCGGEEECVICFTPTKEEGSHRLVSIKCGHVFGEKCIRKWFDLKSECPLCQTRWKLRDIRYHFGTKMGNGDNDKLRVRVYYILKKQLEKSYKKNEKRKRLLKNKEIQLVNVKQSLALMAKKKAKLSRQNKKLNLEITVSEEKEKLRKKEEGGEETLVESKLSGVAVEREKEREMEMEKAKQSASSEWLSSTTSSKTSDTSSSETSTSSGTSTDPSSSEYESQTLTSSSLGSN